MSLVNDVFDFVKQNPGTNGIQIQNKIPDPLVPPSIQQLESNGMILWQKDGYYALKNELETLDTCLDDAIDAVAQIVKDQWLKECPQCHKSAQGEDGIRQKFGFRRSSGKIIPQSYCRKCRSKKPQSIEKLENSYNGILFHTVQEAKNMLRGINLEGVITKKEIPQTVHLRSGGTIKACSAYLVDDHDDEIKITFWADDINRIKNGSRVRAQKCYTSKYNGEITVSLGKYGILEVIYYGERERLKKKFVQKAPQESFPSNDSNWIIDSDDQKKSNYLNTQSSNFEAKKQDYNF